MKKKKKKYLHLNFRHFIFVASFFSNNQQKNLESKKRKYFQQHDTSRVIPRQGKSFSNEFNKYYLNNTAAACAVWSCLCLLGTAFCIGFAGEEIALLCRKALYLLCSAAKSVLNSTLIEPRPYTARDAVAVGFLKSREWE